MENSSTTGMKEHENRSKTVHLNDIAQMVGTTKSTVSAVLTGNARLRRISAELESRILTAAKELNYRPNALARSLRLGRTNIIGVVVPDTSNPTFASLVRCIEYYASKNGYRTMSCSSGEDDAHPDKLIESLIYHQVDGLIIAPTTRMEHELFESLSTSGKPVIIVDRCFGNGKFPEISFDNYALGFRPTQHLLSKGLHRIAIFAFPPDLQHMSDRIKGYQDALKQANIDIDENLIRIIPNCNSEKYIIYAIDELMSLSNRVEGIIFTTNMIGLTAMTYMKELKIQWGKDIKIVSMEAAPYFSLMSPSISVAKLNLDMMAEKAVDILLGRINGEDSKNEQIIIPISLIPRESSI